MTLAAVSPLAFRFRNPNDTSQLGPVFSFVPTGRVWVQTAAMGVRMGINTAVSGGDVHMMFASDPWFQVPIVGPVPSSAQLLTSDLGGYGASGDPDAARYR